MQKKLRFNTAKTDLFIIQDFFWLHAKLNQNDRNYLKSMKCDYCMFAW